MIYDRIKQLREQNGLTQAALARMLNVTRSSVNAWEMGISVPSTQSLVQLAEIFDISTDYLLGVESQQRIDLSGISEEEVTALKNLIKAMRNRH